MRDFAKQYGTWGIVAGAGEGLGAAFALALAKRGQNVVLIDRNSTALDAIAREIEDKYGRKSIKLNLDLAIKNTVNEILKCIEPIDCRMLVYNAAYGPVKSFLSNSEEELDYYIELNSRIPLHLVYGFLKKRMRDKKLGVILMSSLAGLYGTSYVAPYGATKAFNYNLGEALFHEFQGSGIDILACCAGATDTPNYRQTKPKYGLIKPSVMAPQHVAEGSLKRLGQTGLYIPGFNNRLTQFIFTRIFTRKLAVWVMNRTMKGMYKGLV